MIILLPPSLHIYTCIQVHVHLGKNNYFVNFTFIRQVLVGKNIYFVKLIIFKPNASKHGTLYEIINMKSSYKDLCFKDLVLNFRFICPI